MGRQLSPCGTYAAARRHQRNGEELDPRCEAALLEYQKDAARKSRARRLGIPELSAALLEDAARKSRARRKETSS